MSGRNKKVTSPSPFRKDRDNGRGGRRGPKQREPEADSVGYGNPPREHRFREGESGNPRGRPRGAKNESTILREILGKRIEHRSAGRARKITVLEGILLRIADDSLRGDIRSAAFLLNRFGQLVSGELERPDLSDDDRAILAAYVDRVQTTRRTDK